MIFEKYAEKYAGSINGVRPAALIVTVQSLTDRLVGPRNKTSQTLRQKTSCVWGNWHRCITTSYTTMLLPAVSCVRNGFPRMRVFILRLRRSVSAPMMLGPHSKLAASPVDPEPL